MNIFTIIREKLEGPIMSAVISFLLLICSLTKDTSKESAMFLGLSAAFALRATAGYLKETEAVAATTKRKKEK